MAEAAQTIRETIIRPCAPFNPVETEVMTLILKKFFNEQVAAVIQKLKPDLLPRIQNNKQLFDYRVFFQILNRIINPEWVNNEQFFEHGWQDFVEMAKRTYLSIKKDVRISNIRPGMNVKNFTRAGFYGMILTADYCSDEMKNPGLPDIFNSCIRYFTLSFEKDPDEVLADVKFINQLYVAEVFHAVISSILRDQLGTSAPFQTEIRSRVNLMNVLKDAEEKSQPDKVQAEKAQAVFGFLKKAYYLSLVNNYGAMLKGQKTAIGYSNEKSELLSFDHPQVQTQFRIVTQEPDWKIDPETTEMALHINIFRSQPGNDESYLLSNLVRGVLECVKAELPLLNSTSLIKGKNIRQGMERELTEAKYFPPVIQVLTGNMETIRRILQNTKGR
jgi:hypothetical protein